MSLIINPYVFTAPSAGAIVEFVNLYQFTASASSYIAPAVPLGADEANRVVLVGRMSESTGSTTNGGLTIGGTAATLITPAGTSSASGYGKCGLYYRVVPTGATADIVATFGSTQNACGLGVWILRNLISTAPYDTAGSNGNATAPIVVDVPAGGIGVRLGFSTVNFSPTMFADVDFGISFDTLDIKGESEAFASATTVTASDGTNAGAGFKCAASFG
jgi:hypothetical protein